MNVLHKKLILPAGFCLSSLLILALLMSLTSPLKQIAYAVIFFILLAVFLISLGFFVTTLQTGAVGRKARSRIFLITIFIVLILMFRSAGSLSWVGLLILLLIIGGLIFYSGKRGQ